MAAPRSLRPLLAPAKRTKIIPPRSSAQTLLRCKSDRANRNDGRDIYAEIERGDKSIEQRLQHMGINPEEYHALKRSEIKAQEKFDKWIPKTKQDAQRKWQKMVNSPDDLTMLEMFKREGLDVLKEGKARGMKLPTDKDPLDPKTQAALDALRTPINVQAVHLRPLRRTPTHGLPVCDLQLRTYSIRNLLLFADFAVRAAYYMGLCARGPVPLPRITERWTVPRANFIFKKSQENFERVTMRRLIQIQDGHPDVVKAWLAFLQKHQYHGVGMKANIWEYESLETATRAGYDIEQGDYSRRREGPMLEKVDEILNTPAFKEAMKGWEAPKDTELRP
ncbi:ribosomal protein S10 [Bimuria novae-zelandiae CBS 107.79]|uniref:Small ribosomal subunit protein uS10m n=1 Tax=Bimuria novae-zelandiae CBS 107.79 TaxID=1447943 RepID=A0A6A5V338_9PLEO|nr:ribosomal protein S10 [Bimuria novae-zelandiae CBS 107.79]